MRELQRVARRADGRAREAARPPAPAAARLLALQRGAGNRAVAGMLARMPIASLGVDTAKDSKEAILKALTAKWNKFMGGFSVKLTEAEAKALLKALGDDVDEGIKEDLEAIANPEGSDDETPQKGSAASSDEETSWDDDEALFTPSAKEKAKQPADKRDLGLRFARVMQDLKQPVFLSGGGAVTLLGSPREIKDLDFRTELGHSWSDEAGDALIERIDDALAAEFEVGVYFQVSDVETGYTIKTTILGVEVSVTRTPQVAYLGHGAKPGQMPSLGGFDLILDKCYSLIMRTERPKMHSDLFDLLFVLRATRGGVNVLPFLTMQRGAAYQGQRGRRQLDANIIQQLVLTLRELLAEDATELEAFFDAKHEKALLATTQPLLQALDLLIQAPPQKLGVI